ncbi:MAG: ABC transporter permease, partial [Candidatus Acidiferrales bacterium]
VIHGVLLNPLPYPDSDRLVRFTETLRGMALNISYPNFLDWRERAHTLEDMAIYNPYSSATLTGVERAERLPAAFTESRLFRLFGVQPALGRFFTPEEEKPGGESVVIISCSLWERQFGRDPDIIGRSIRLQMAPATVIGVLPPDFRLVPKDVWFPIGLRLDANSLDRANHPGFQAYGRMKRGVSIEQVQQEMSSIARALEQEYPASNADAGVHVALMLDSVAGRVRPMLLVLLGTVAFVLLIACANVSNVLLARALGRSRETAIRAALGAGTARLFRLFLTESLVLALLGGGAGLLLAWWSLDALLAIQPGVIPRAGEVRIYAPVLAYALGVTLLCALLFGTAPAWRAMRLDLVDALRQGGRSSGWGGGTGLRWALVSAQVGLAVVLLIGAGLMIRTLAELGEVDPGFRAENVLAMNTFMPAAKYPGNEKLNAFVERALDQTRSVGGIESAAAVWPLLLSGPQW